ncbi:MAG: hypothetical protein GXO22_02455 [Aquificae bacterium]|nr:hypothetical protein [Aquificota bacterium]
MKLFISLVICLLLFVKTKPAEIGIQDTQTANVLSEYGKVLTDFVVNNLNDADYFLPTKEYSLIIRPFISWIGTDYNLCLELLSSKQYTLKIVCMLARDGESLYKTLNQLFEELGDFYLKEKKEKKVYILIKTKTKPRYSQYKIESQKGDILVYYKPAVQKNSSPKDSVIDLGKVIIGLNSIYLNKEQAVTLFKFLLENYKIEQILIKKY